MEPDRAAKVTKAKALVVAFRDDAVPSAVELSQFDTVKLPRLLAGLYATPDTLDRLHPHSRGAAKPDLQSRQHVRHGETAAASGQTVLRQACRNQRI